MALQASTRAELDTDHAANDEELAKLKANMDAAKSTI
eukprot:COSAG06_NODE_17096_length_961_cov_1.205336_2_plen_36_part_01